MGGLPKKTKQQLLDELHRANARVRQLEERFALLQDRVDRRLVQTDRRASLGALMDGFSHQLSNPLTYLAGSLAVLDERLRGQSWDVLARLGNSLDLVQQAREGVARVHTSIQSLKAFLGAARDESNDVDVQPLIEAAIGIAQNEIRLRAVLVTRFAPIPPVRARPAQLAQVFLGVLTNAAQAIPEGDADANTITVTTRQDAHGAIVVEISDSGGGIRSDDIGRIFEPFFSMKSSEVGAGIGLTAAKAVLDELGGRITVSSELGRGSTFRIYLQAAPQLGVRDVDARTGTNATGSWAARILVIDDDPAVAQFFVEALTGHRVVVARSGREALELVAARSDFDVIFCDLMMPSMSGMEVHQQISQLWPRLEKRMVFVTGGAFTERTRQFLASSGNECMEKPFDIAAIQSVVRARRP